MAQRIAKGLLLSCLTLVLIGFAAGKSATAGAPSDAPPGSVTTYQQNALHDGKGTGVLALPLSLAWSVDLGAAVSYPLVVNGRVFVATENADGSYGAKLYALDEMSGTILWGPIDLPGWYSINGIAADGSKVYSVNWNGLLRAFDQISGQGVWQFELPNQLGITSPPTVRAGRIFVSTGTGRLYAVEAVDGSIAWEAPIAGGHHSSPAVTDDAVYGSYACGAAYRFDVLTGQQVWAHPTHCSGGGGRTPVVHGERLYVRVPTKQPDILSTTDGSSLGTFASRFAPAFDGNLAFFTPQGSVETELAAIDLITNETLWSTSADGGIASPPIVVDGYVLVVSSMGNVFAFDQLTGNQVWSSSLGNGFDNASEHNADMLAGVAVADGMLFIPAKTTLVAFRSSTEETPMASQTPNATPTPRPVGGVAFDAPSGGRGALDAWWVAAMTGAACVLLGGAVYARRHG